VSAAVRPQRQVVDVLEDGSWDAGLLEGAEPRAKLPETHKGTRMRRRMTANLMLSIDSAVAGGSTAAIVNMLISSRSVRGQRAVATVGGCDERDGSRRALSHTLISMKGIPRSPATAR